MASKAQPANPWAAVDALRVSRSRPRGRRPGAFTADEYATRHSLGRRSAADELNRMVADGDLKSEIAVLDGHVTRLYWIAVKKDVSR